MKKLENEVKSQTDSIEQVEERHIHNSTPSKKESFRYNKTNIRNRRMIIRIIFVSIIFYMLSSLFDLYEKFDVYLHRNEKYDVDEFVIAGVFLAIWLIMEMYILLKNIQKQSRVYEKSSTIDPLTQILNRRGFFYEAEERCKNLSKTSSSLYIYYIDLLKFKDINDTYGHLTGDIVLKEVTNYLQSFLCDEDIVARIGGDEFVILGTSKKVNIQEEYTNKLQQAIKVVINDRKDILEVLLSYGEAIYPIDGNNLEDLLKNADERMYLMKKNQYIEK